LFKHAVFCPFWTPFSLVGFLCRSVPTTAGRKPALTSVPNRSAPRPNTLYVTRLAGNVPLFQQLSPSQSPTTRFVPSLIVTLRGYPLPLSISSSVGGLEFRCLCGNAPYSFLLCVPVARFPLPIPLFFPHLVPSSQPPVSR